MLTAKEAAKMAEVSYEKSLATVLQRIEKQASQGKVSIWFHAEYPEKVFKTLEELGYTVVFDADGDAVVSW